MKEEEKGPGRQSRCCVSERLNSPSLGMRYRHLISRRIRMKGVRRVGWLDGYVGCGERKGKGSTLAGTDSSFFWAGSPAGDDVC